MRIYTNKFHILAKNTLPDLFYTFKPRPEINSLLYKVEKSSYVHHSKNEFRILFGEIS